jgi:hypothetical protein
MQTNTSAQSATPPTTDEALHALRTAPETGFDGLNALFKAIENLTDSEMVRTLAQVGYTLVIDAGINELNALFRAIAKLTDDDMIHTLAQIGQNLILEWTFAEAVKDEAVATSPPTVLDLAHAHCASMQVFFDLAEREIAKHDNSDFDNMAFLTAAAKAETLRFGNLIYSELWESGKDTSDMESQA